MASGSTVTASGMLTMTQVVAGTDLVDDADFNNARDNVNLLLGAAQDVALGTFTPASTYGYNQGGSGISNAIAGTDIKAAGTGNGTTISGGFAELQADVLALCNFTGVAPRAGVGTLVTTSTTVLASTWNNLMLNVQDVWNNRFTPASLSAPTQATTVSTTVTWTNTLTQVTTWTFTSEQNCRAFFNMGGRLGVSLDRTGGTVSTQNTTWTTRLSAMGDVMMSHDTTYTSAGTNSGIGFYELTAVDQNLVQYYGAAAPYNQDYVLIKGRVNSTTNPTQVIITVQLRDEGDNAIDSPVDGTLTVRSKYAQPGANGSGFSIPTYATAYSVSMAAISGS